MALMLLNKHPEVSTSMYNTVFSVLLQ